MKKVIVLIVVVILFALTISGCGKAKGGNFSDEMKINKSVDLSEEDGADSVEREGDHKNSPYFSNLDFYNMKSNSTLTILPNYKTYQQTSESSCGIAATITVLDYFGKLNDNTEESLAKMRNSTGDYKLTGATSVKQVLNIFDHLGGFTVSSTYDYYNTTDENSTPYFEDGYASGIYSVITLDWIKQELKNNTPVMVCWCDWGGHWEVIIGYDDMGTETTQDDVLIMADSYDTTDHNQDGYGVYSAERFYYNWTMYDFFDGTEFSIERDFLFVAVKPTK